MQKMLNLVSKTIKKFNLIESGDSVAVCVSGGKDSMVLLECLSRIKKYFNIDFDLMAITINLNFFGDYDNFDDVKKFCSQRDIFYFVEKSIIADVVFKIRNEKSACSLCSKMRKGLINSIAKRYGCNKVALGHSLDDAVETFLMNLFSAGKLACFAPKNYLSRIDLFQIRPLIFALESDILDVATRLKLPVVESRCYVNGKTNREVVKKFLKNEEFEFKNIKKLIFSAIKNSNLEGWN